ncbi:uncharacterized protein LOC117955920 isoform X2 [Etheostoma cragini]|uniref:uncharacterized protein LOC117955920 isoform X2 n=1 Tax=Etheostoma cragini TaxID=417921 RepID=UPI00155F0E44|nr:uncharacterized protein LOC117955920 isoform X2 [Etheostoma cragini]
MDYLRKYLWLWVIIAVIFACGIISIIFFFINKCISRRGKHRISQLQRRSPDFTVESNKYQETGLKINTPPLPPRTQFLTAESQSYENLAEVPECQNIPDYEEDNHDYEEAVPDYEQDKHDYEQAMPNYEQAMAEQSDYVKVEDEEVILPPPYMDQDQAEDNTSTEDYDDIADANHSEEDYDDVG